ncbi:uncharacterized protein LOC110739808 [Chenopodium quinoa]|uniref:uncharacterized protein LOC110739808 n=1 Tax=Chenopodium quinoa TaxID=63459 RepID=UPI000B76E9F0|nr:uncharacterized protein LOC110739808 [Chenopodium quinoa]
MSPLLFVLAMEYLSRLLRKVGKLRQFRVHSRCKRIGQNHLIFADDLMLFCYGDSQSISLIHRALKTFGNCSGLQANKAKTAIYFGNTSISFREQTLRHTGFSEGSFPFRYLGIPLNAKYLRFADYDGLVDKMLSRITCWASRNLSYAARVVLIKSVLMSLHVYWAQCLLLPASVLDRITQICRAFLWDGSANLSRSPPISWDWVCKPKATGGLGIRNCKLWNKAALGKYVWKIVNKEDSLWVRWVHSIYLKDQEWWDYKPKSSAGWEWKKLCKVKDDLHSGFLEKAWAQHKYKISEVYDWLQGNNLRVVWHTWIWNNFNSPKHAFISWLAMHNRLKTRDRLERFDFCEDSNCLLCGNATETRSHLFFECPYSRRSIDMIAVWLGIKNSCYNIDVAWLHWRKQFKDPICRKVGTAGLASVIYHLWFARNHAYWFKAVIHPRILCRGICIETVDRSRQLITGSWTRKQCKWLYSLKGCIL